jgi:hypothetical protein
MATTSKSGDKPVKATAKPATKAAAKPKTAKAKTETTAKAPAVKKPAAPKAATPKAAPAKKAPALVAAPFATKPASMPVLTPDQRRYYVEVAAFYIAERRGFHGGSQMDDWVTAEAEIDRLLREGILKP